MKPQGWGSMHSQEGSPVFSGSQIDRDRAQQVTLLSPSLQSRTEVARLGPCNSLPLVLAPGCRNWLGQLSCGLSWCPITYFWGSFPVPTVPPSILGEELNISVVVNETVALECQSHAMPPPVLRWQKDGRPLEPHPGIRFSADKALLEVCRGAG